VTTLPFITMPLETLHPFTATAVSRAHAHACSRVTKSANAQHTTAHLSFMTGQRVFIWFYLHILFICLRAHDSVSGRRDMNVFFQLSIKRPFVKRQQRKRILRRKVKGFEDKEK